MRTLEQSLRKGERVAHTFSLSDNVVDNVEVKESKERKDKVLGEGLEDVAMCN